MACARLLHEQEVQEWGLAFFAHDATVVIMDWKLGRFSRACACMGFASEHGFTQRARKIKRTVRRLLAA